jgi:acyl-coenzyme A synthetase/AMP-(fatty) acid ligase
VTLSAGASVRLLTSMEAMMAPWQVRQLAGWGLTFWYSVPSALVAMLEQGGLSAAHWPSARVILFAGEVFPTPALRRLRRALPGPRLVNLYGPTETNVCTWYEVGDLPDTQTAPIPIGRVCENLHGAVLDDALREVARGAEGDLWIGGGNLLTAYWNDPALTARRLKPDPRPGREGLLYHTGDRVREGDDGHLVFLGRRDHMVKVRGYRVELGEVESALHGYDGVAEVAVVALPDPEAGQRLEAWVVSKPGRPLDEGGLRVFLKDRLPLYMLPARIRPLDALPRTSTGKIDRVTLTERAAGDG